MLFLSVCLWHIKPKPLKSHFSNINACDFSLEAVGSEESQAMGNRPLGNAAQERCWCTVLGFVFSGLQEDLLWYHMNGCIRTEINFGKFLRSSGDVAQVIGYPKFQAGVVVPFSNGRNVGHQWRGCHTSKYKTASGWKIAHCWERSTRSVHYNGNYG
jgi:hypothetical protein